ncbi:hypothetical protein E4U17_006682 [Claviceps sp. LM77 group G4]|nr:hypothetical protein E4U17_006682 [Claviceps sp. LM77 group G4]
MSFKAAMFFIVLSDANTCPPSLKLLTLTTPTSIAEPLGTSGSHLLHKSTSLPKHPEQGVSSQVGDFIPNSPTTSPSILTTVQHQLEVSELKKKQRIAQSEARGRVLETEAAQDAALLNLATQGLPMPNAPSADTANTTSEHSPHSVLKISRELAGVSAEDVNDIYTGKFEPWNLIHLHPVRGPSYI